MLGPRQTIAGLGTDCLTPHESETAYDICDLRQPSKSSDTDLASATIRSFGGASADTEAPKTTLMIRNVPLMYTQELLLEERGPPGCHCGSIARGTTCHEHRAGCSHPIGCAPTPWIPTCVPDLGSEFKDWPDQGSEFMVFCRPATGGGGQGQLGASLGAPLDPPAAVLGLVHSSDPRRGPGINPVASGHADCTDSVPGMICSLRYRHFWHGIWRETVQSA